jgi:hypothetical protein
MCATSQVSSLKQPTAAQAGEALVSAQFVEAVSVEVGAPTSFHPQSQLRAVLVLAGPVEASEQARGNLSVSR